MFKGGSLMKGPGYAEVKEVAQREVGLCLTSAAQGSRFEEGGGSTGWK